MVFCGEGKRLNLPPEFGLPDNITLGMSISQLRKERNPKDVDSVPCWHEEIAGNRYFEGISYNCDNEYFSFHPGELVTVGLGASHQESNAGTDSLALEIISICCKHFGDAALVIESTKHEGRRLLVWSSDGLTAGFFYMPSDRLKLSERYHAGISDFYLEIGLHKKVDEYLEY